MGYRIALHWEEVKIEDTNIKAHVQEEKEH
jgi:hypothetical protein